MKKKDILMNLKVTVTDADENVDFGYFTIQLSKKGKLIFWPDGHGVKKLILEYLYNEFLKENFDIIGAEFYGTEYFFKRV